MEPPEGGLWILVIAGSESATVRGEILEEHSITDQAQNLGRKLIEKAGDTWGVITSQISTMLLQTSSAIGDYHAESVTVQLGIDARGNIGVVQAGLTASFEITFKKASK